MAHAAVDLAVGEGQAGSGAPERVRQFPVTLKIRRSCGCEGAGDADGAAGAESRRGDSPGNSEV
jgi:hypothetical protein